MGSQVWCSTLATCKFISFFCTTVRYTDQLDRFLVSLLDFLVGGSIGYVATYFMLRRLYTSIRVD